MTVPLIGQQPAGICVVCKGRLTPDHEHVYIDKKQLDYMENVIVDMLNLGCVVPVETTGQLAAGHPHLPPPLMWYPVVATHAKHYGCDYEYPHHHCASDDMLEEILSERDGSDEVPAADVGA